MNIKLIASFTALNGSRRTNYSFTKSQLYSDISLSIALLANDYSPKSFSKYRKLQAIAPAYWPFELIPLDANYCYISDLLFKTSVKLPVGKFSGLFNAQKRFKANNGSEFLTKLKDGLREIQDPKSYEFRNESLEGIMEPPYFEALKPFFMNLGHLFFDSFFILDWDTRKINHNDNLTIYSKYFDPAPERELAAIADDTQTLINEWIEKLQQFLLEEKKKKKDPALEKEKKDLERKLQEARQKEPEDSAELIKNGEFPFPNLNSDFENELNGMKATVSNLRTTCKASNIIKTEGYLSDLKRSVNNIARYLNDFESELQRLKRNAENRSKDKQRAIDKERDDIERQLKNVQREIDESERENTRNTEELSSIINELKEISRTLPKTIENAQKTLESIRDTIIQQTLLPIRADRMIVGLPIYVFFFAESKNEIGIRIPVLSQLIDENSKNNVKTIVEKPHKNLLEDMFTYLNQNNKRIEEVNRKCVQQNVLEYREAKRAIEDGIDRLNNNGILQNKARKRAIELINEFL